MNKKIIKLGVVAVLFLLAVIFFTSDARAYLSLEYLSSHKNQFLDFYRENPLATSGGYFFLYIIATALSLPGAAILTLAGGAVFGFVKGLVLVSFASTIGATAAFLVSRFILRDYVQGKFGDKLKQMNAGVEKEGGYYLFTLRLVPVFPFFLINLLMGLTPLKTTVFYGVSQLGMLAGTAVYVYAGTQLGAIDSLAGLISPGLLIAFALLGVFPLAAKKSLGAVEKRKVYRNYPRPAAYDYNLIVIGAGSAGLVTSYIASQVKAKVALIEKDKMGGDCLNTGCVPSKSLIRSAKVLSYIKRAGEFGIKHADARFNFRDVMGRVREKIAQVEPHDSVERYSSLGVTCIKGSARIISPFSVEVNGEILTTRSIVVATGARPFVPPIAGIEKIDYLTSDNLWELEELPERLLVLGGGPIGCEMAQAFARMGADVTQVEKSDRIMGREDRDVSELMAWKFQSEGIKLLTGYLAEEVIVEGENNYLLCRSDEGVLKVPFDRILVSVGRVPNISGFGLEELGVRISPRGTVEVNELLQTNFPNIYCAGDVAGPYQFTHTASHQAWYASVNALFGHLKSFKADYRVIPWTTYTDPEVARVGMSESDAIASGTEYEVTRYELDDLDRAITDSETHGFVKVLTRKGSDRILGVTIAGYHAGDIISEYVLAMKNNIGLKKILGTIHVYPTMSEANKYAAGAWQKNNKPEKILEWLEKFHAWMRN